MKTKIIIGIVITIILLIIGCKALIQINNDIKININKEKINKKK